MNHSLDIVIFGLSITSSWGNGHATTYRALVRGLAARGHRVLFLERDVPWYARHRDLEPTTQLRVALYASLEQLRDTAADAVRSADLVIVGSFVPDGVEVARWVLDQANGATAFYDIDTPVTLAKLARGDYEYLLPDLIPRFDLYLSFTGGPVLQRLERQYGSPCARPLYCSVDPDAYQPRATRPRHDLGYMGTYSDDRWPAVQRLLVAAAEAWPLGQFVVAGPLYPASLPWPANVERIDHLPPPAHQRFYTTQRFTLNVTRADMVRTGFSPSVRLFEAAACGTPIISDYWNGIETFFQPGREVLIARHERDVLGALRELPEGERQAIGRRARSRVLACHTAAHRAAELEQYVLALSARR